MAENPNLVCPSSSSLSFCCELELGEMGTQKMKISDQEEGFVVNIDNLSHTMDKDITANSRITLQKTFSRKLSQRGERKITCQEQEDCLLGGGGGGGGGGVADGSFKEAASVGDCKQSDKSVIVNVVGLGPTEEPTMISTTEQSTQKQQIVIKSNGADQSKCRRYNKQRSPFWMDPRRVFLFFATLSSMGTIILIYFTLSVGKLSGDDHAQ
ncbi:hypothetical protein BVC80_8751g13 [Macleaya cordata]|uniref:Transmembrane protein n=1 Tax=Macleaya cordata TaxID=56857 RepID=A0A200QKG8_MACCD|nr:hypothetical protein BVC80_8751g13 [Macleaya cordata]